MKIKDVFDEIRNEDYPDGSRLWLEGVRLSMYNPDEKLVRSPEFIEEPFLSCFKDNELEITDYDYWLDEDYKNFAVVECVVLLKEKL